VQVLFLKHLINSKVGSLIIYELFKVLLQLLRYMIYVGHVVPLQKWHRPALIVPLIAFFVVQNILLIKCQVVSWVLAESLAGQ
jgi:hypothetical protein